MHPIPAGQYAEDKARAADRALPGFVSILKADMPSPDTRQAEAANLAENLAPICNRSLENIHIIYLPNGPGRLAFGGKLLEQQQIIKFQSVLKMKPPAQIFKA